MKHIVPIATITGIGANAGADKEAHSTDEKPPTAVLSPLELEEKVVDVLKSCYDPEIPVDVYELGLIYNIDIDAESNVVITMTLTAPACPVAETMPGDIENRVRSIPEAKSVRVELTFDPPWDKSRMSEAAQFQLGFL